MTNETTTALVPSSPLPQLKTLVVVAGDLTSYQASVYAEAQQRVARWEAAVDEAENGLAYAELANEDVQVKLWKSQRTRRVRRQERARAFLRVVEAGYLPIPRMPGVPLEMLDWRRSHKLLPPEALLALSEAKEIEGWTRFELIDGRDWNGRLLRRGTGADPILVGVCDGEMFPLAWWR